MKAFEAALKRLDRHIWYMCHKFEVSIRGQEVEDLHQEALIKLYEIYTSARYSGKSTKELDFIFKKALWNMLRDMYATARRDFHLFTEFDVDVEGMAEAHSYDAFLDVYVAYHKEYMARSLSQRALHLLELLLNPTPAVYHMYNIHCMRRRALRSQGFNVRIPQKITHELVGSVLGFTKAITKTLMKELQEAWAICRNLSTPSSLRLSVATF